MAISNSYVSLPEGIVHSYVMLCGCLPEGKDWAISNIQGP